MLPPDMQGGMPPPPGLPPEGGPPPELLAQLMGGAGAGAGPPPEPEAPPEMSPLDHLRQAIEHAQAALVGEPDDADSQALSKVLTGLYAIFANRQKEQESLLGGGNLRALSRQ